MTMLTSWILRQDNLGSDFIDANSAALIGTDFAGAGAPKLKFMFTAEFGIGYNEFSGMEKGAKRLDEIKLDLKMASRPNIVINYEDANYYGFRTKVATRANFGQLKITFYEDSFNRANSILWNYLNIVSPLTVGPHGNRISTHVASGPNDAGSGVQGFDSANGVSTIGALPNGYQDGLIQFIKLHHYYIGEGYTPKITTYTYYNPKLESLEYDELDMASSEPSTITATFLVDAIRYEEDTRNVE